MGCIQCKMRGIQVPIYRNQTEENARNNVNDSDKPSSPINHLKVKVRVSERELPPLPSPPPPTPTVMCRAMYDFEGISKDDISFKKGDKLEVDEESMKIDDWWVAVNLRTQKTGYVPSNYITKDDGSPQHQEWWFDVDHKESDKLLMGLGVRKGHFLIRQSRDKLSLVLSVRDDTSPKHYRIKSLENGGYYISPKRQFDTMLDLIDHYTCNSDGLCTVLTTCVPRSPPMLHFPELEVSREAVKTTSVLGVGCFGEVLKGTLHNVIDVAVKRLKPGTMSPQAFLAEAKSMHQLRHKRLVQLIAVCSKDEPILIVTELMKNGSLLDYMRRDEGKTLQFSTILEMASQIAEGMAFLEDMKFIHRDLRAANILVCQNLDVKIADFGLARLLHDEDFYEATERTKFPVKWTAPEAASYRKFSIKADVWSFGILLYELITFGKIPYPGMSGTEVLRNVERGYRMPKPASPIPYTDAYYDVMLRCWHKVPQNRPTFEYLHALFNDFDVSMEDDYDESRQM